MICVKIFRSLATVPLLTELCVKHIVRNFEGKHICSQALPSCSVLIFVLHICNAAEIWKTGLKQMPLNFNQRFHFSL